MRFFNLVKFMINIFQICNLFKNLELFFKVK